MEETSLTAFPVYYQSYVAQVPENDPVTALKNSAKLRKHLLADWPEERQDFAYAPGKWTVKELLSHLADSERVFVYRALRFSRNDETGLPGYDHNAYVPESGANERSFDSIAKELKQVRRATISFFTGLTRDQLARTGSANKVEMSVEQLAFVIAGHERHHLGVLEERYLR